MVVSLLLAPPIRALRQAIGPPGLSSAHAFVRVAAGWRSPLAGLRGEATRRGRRRPKAPLSSAKCRRRVVAEGHWTDSGGESYRLPIETQTHVTALWSRWMVTSARYGAGYSLVDKLERCRMVCCTGSSFYLALRTYGA